MKNQEKFSEVSQIVNETILIKIKKPIPQSLANKASSAMNPLKKMLLKRKINAIWQRMSKEQQERQGWDMLAKSMGYPQ